MSAISRSDLLLAAGLAALTFLLFLPFAAAGVDFHHDGVMLKPAIDLLNGQVLHRDTFNQYGPLTTLIHAGLLEVFGRRLLVLRIATIAMEAASLGLLVLWWRTLLPRILVLTSVLLWLCTAYLFIPFSPLFPWSSSAAMLFQSGCLLLLAIATRSKHEPTRLWAVAAAGVLASATFWCRQPVGGFLAIAGTSIPLLLQHRKTPVRPGFFGRVLHHSLLNRYLLVWSAGGIGFAGVMLGWLYQQGPGALEAWFLQNVVWPRQFAASYLSAELLLDCFFSTRVIVSLSGLLILVFAIRFFFRDGTSTLKRVTISALLAWIWFGTVYWSPRIHTPTVFDRSIPLAITGFVAAAAIGRRWRFIGFVLQRGLLLPVLASWSQFYPIPCARHMYWSVAPMVGLFVYLLYRTIPCRPRTLTVALGVFILPLAILVNTQAWTHLQICDAPIAEPGLLQGMRPYRSLEYHPGWYRCFNDDTDWFLKFRTELAAKYPGKPLMLIGEDALLTLAVENTENPGPFYVTWEIMKDVVPAAERIAWAGKRLPLVLIQSRSGKPPDVPAELPQLGYEQQYLGRRVQRDLYLLTPPATAATQVPQTDPAE